MYRTSGVGHGLSLAVAHTCFVEYSTELGFGSLDLYLIKDVVLALAASYLHRFVFHAALVPVLGTFLQALSGDRADASGDVIVGESATLYWPPAWGWQSRAVGDRPRFPFMVYE